MLQCRSISGRDRLPAQLTFDASLFDSKLLAFTLSGDMAVRLAGARTPTSC